jgi:exopolysaccharide biosynthesis polyprenyl glycosylphosphotransferase
MTSMTSLSSQSNLDLRAPVFTRLRRGIKARWIQTTILISLDAIVLFLAWQIAAICEKSLGTSWTTLQSSLSLLPIMTTDLSLIAVQGLYDSRQKHPEYLSLIQTITLSRFLLLVFAYFYQQGDFVFRLSFFLSWLFSAALICIARFSIATTLEYFYKQGAIGSPIFLICRSEDKQKVTNLLEQENHYKILGWVDVDSVAGEKNSWDSTIDNISRLGIAEVFVCSWECIKGRMFLYWKLRNAGITLRILPVGLKAIDDNFQLKMLDGTPALKLSPPLITGSDFLIKRYFDFCFSTIFLILFSPLYLCIALLIKLDSPGPIFYKQKRIGLHGKPFEIWKFRTMLPNADQIQKDLEASNEMKDGILFKIKNDPRITRFGGFLRRYSLDELPQIFNVILGDMSLVGPRPLPIRDVEKFSEHHFIRHEVLPGITGLWQVSGRSNITDFEDVIRLDRTYIENWSLSLDWKILLQTVLVVIRKRGAY